MNRESRGDKFTVDRYSGKSKTSSRPTVPALLTPKAVDKASAKASKKDRKQLEAVAKAIDVTESARKRFGLKATELAAQAHGGDVDGSVSNFTLQAYATIMALIPIAEREYRRGRREHQAYVLNSLVSQGRELGKDLRANDDRRRLGELVINEILEPAFRSMVQVLMQSNMTTKAMLSDKVTSGKEAAVSGALDEELRAQARELKILYTKTADQVRSKLIG